MYVMKNIIHTPEENELVLILGRFLKENLKKKKKSYTCLSNEAVKIKMFSAYHTRFRLIFLFLFWRPLLNSMGSDVTRKKPT